LTEQSKPRQNELAMDEIPPNATPSSVEWFRQTRSENEKRFWYANLFLLLVGVCLLVWGLSFIKYERRPFVKTLVSTTGIVFLAFVAQNAVFAGFHAGQAYQRRPMITAMYPPPSSNSRA
jgi:hypothetical protein